MLTITKNQERLFQEHLGIKKEPGEHEKRLLKKARKYSTYFQYIPGVLCICVGNSVAMNNAHKDSDIDLFIITKKNRLWTTRVFMTIFLSILGERKTDKKHAGKFCLSFFITVDHINLQDIAIKNDIYLYCWIKSLIPIVDKEGTFHKFKHANSGVLECEIKALPRNGAIGNIYESFVKYLFLRRTKKSFQKLGKPFGVIIGDDILKFHDKDRRKEIRNAIF